jgi:hypothetical protein
LVLNREQALPASASTLLPSLKHRQPEEAMIAPASAATGYRF